MAKRICRVCGTEFDRKECPACKSRRRKAVDPEANREAARTWRAANRERHRASVKAWRAANPEQYRKQLAKNAREWRANNRERYLRNHRSHTYRSLYGITLAEVEAMQERQGNKCLICEGEMRSGKGARCMVVDHYVLPDGTRVVRGLLHHECNVGLGMLGDHDPVVLRRAADYLERHGTHKLPAA